MLSEVEKSEWAAKMEQQHEENSARFEAIEARQNEFSEELSTNTKVTREGNENISTLLAIVQGGRKGVRTGLALGRWLSVLAKWAQPIVWLIVVVWALLHGHMPKPPGEE